MPDTEPTAPKATKDANLTRDLGATKEIYDGMNRLVHSEERDETGKLLRVTIFAYFLDGSCIETIYDFTKTPAAVIQIKNPQPEKEPPGQRRVNERQ